MHRKRIGELLVDAGLLRLEHLPVGLREAQQRSLKLGEVLVMLRYLSSEDLECVLQAQTKLEEGAITEGHAIAALRFAAENRLAFDEALRNTQSEALSEDVTLLKELEKLEDQLKKAERFGNNREVGVLLMQMADLHCRCFKEGEAEQCLKKALQSFERSFGQKHLKVAACQARLAELYFSQGRYSDAETLYWRVLDITQGAWGHDHIDVAQCHKALACLLEAQGRLKEAEQFYLSSLRILERVAGDNSPELTDTLRLLAAFWRKQGKKPEHKRLGDLLVEANMIRADQLQSTLLYCQQGNIPLGQGLLQHGHLTHDQLRPALQAQLLISDGVLPVQIAVRALRITNSKRSFQEALDELGWRPDSFTTEELTVLINAAEELLSAEATLGTNHAGVAVLTSKLADLHSGQQRYAEAEPLYKRSLAILEQAFGPKDPEVATACCKLATLYLADNKPLEAEKLLWRAMEIRQAVQGKEHIDVAECLDLLGLAQERQENYEQAQRYYQSALQIRESLFGRTDYRLGESVQRVADAFYRQQQFEQAEQFYLRLLKLNERHYGSLHVELTPVLQQLGELYMSLQSYSKAETQFELALEIHEQNHTSADRVARLMEQYALLLQATGREDESRTMMERAQILKRLRAM